MNLYKTLPLVFFFVTGRGIAADTQITFHGTLKKPACTISVPNDNVDLGDHTTGEFSKVGTESDTADFTIDIKGCGAGIKNAILSFSGTADSSDAALLATDSGDGNAAGLAVKIENTEGTQININSADNTYPIDEGDNELAFKARLKSVAEINELKEGNISAVMQINVSYQ